MTKKTLIKFFAGSMLLYLLVAGVLYFAAGTAFTHDKYEFSNIANDEPVTRIMDGVTVSQTILTPCSNITAISLYTATYDRVNQGSVLISVYDKPTKEQLFSTAVSAQALPNNGWFSVPIQEQLMNLKSGELEIVVTGDFPDEQNFVTIWSSSVSIPDTVLTVNEIVQNKTLNIQLAGTYLSPFGQHYPMIVFFGFMCLGGYFIRTYLLFIKGRHNLLILIMNAYHRYHFLLRQLISRDFKHKYKRSLLGAFWSILNPLLTMLVQYIVFSTLFKNDIPNFSVYLLIGIVMFSFFTESCGMGIGSITDNAALLTKIYLPKYIYPLSRTVSSAINLSLSFIPLVLVILLTQVKITWAFLLLPFPIICLFLFTAGITLLLSSAMVFFRDTQFLWNVCSLLWLYATPIFYPESIIPSQLSLILKLNPLHHFIRFTRSIILGGVSPEPKAYLYCLIFSVGALFAGLFVFKKSQDKFIVNL